MQSDILSYGPSYNHKPTITVKSIFTDNNNWDAFRLSEKANLRDVEIKEVNKMMTCKDANRGFFTYYCEILPFDRSVIWEFSKMYPFQKAG